MSTWFILWDNALGAKPEAAVTLFEGACGLRYCRVGDKYGFYVSDLDPAFAFHNGQPMYDRDFMNIVGRNINSYYGAGVVQHGTHIAGFFNQVPGASQNKLWDEVYIFNGNGFVGEGPLWTEYNRFGGRYFPPPGLGERGK